MYSHRSTHVQLSPSSMLRGTARRTLGMGSMVVALIVGPSTTFAETPRVNPAAPSSSAVDDIDGRFVLVEDNQNLCMQLLAMIAECKKSWESLGGGSTGQAGAFKECIDLYTAAGQTAGCW